MYEEQARDLLVTPHTLQQNLIKRYKAKRFKKPRTTAISRKNKNLRIAHGQAYRGQTIRDFWKFVYFTDEVYFNSLELLDKQEYKLRIPGSQRRLENLQETQSLRLKVTVHVAAGISYNHKGPIIFYNDPAEPNIKLPYKPRRLRRSSVETAEEHTEHVRA
jgi:hypothetical protein